MEPVIVCDSGSHITKCGFAGTDFPQYLIPSVIATAHFGGPLEQVEQIPFGTSPLVGNLALKFRNCVQLDWPVDGKYIRNFSHMELLWDEVFRKLEVWDLSDCKMIITQGCFPSKRMQNKVQEILFERYQLKGLQLASPSVALYGQGLLSGVVVDMGSTTEIGVFVEGVQVPTLTKQLRIGCRSIRSQLERLLYAHGYHRMNHDSLWNFIEKHGYIALDPAAEQRLAAETCFLNEKFLLLDGNSISLAKERFMAPEILFEPWLADISSPGIGSMVADAIWQADQSIQKKLAKKILLCGGCSVFPGMASRMEQDVCGNLSRRCNSRRPEELIQKDVRVLDHPNRKYLMYTGASVLGKIMEKQDKFWMTREEFLETNNTCSVEFDFK